LSQEITSAVQMVRQQNTAPPQAFTPGGQQQNAPVICRWGRSGEGKVFNASYSSTETFYMDQQVVEKSQ
jgi:hypothetical protein